MGSLDDRSGLEEVGAPATGHETVDGLRMHETVEAPLAPAATVDSGRRTVATRVFSALRGAVRYVRSFDVADGMTLDEQDKLLADFDAERRANTDPVMDFAGHYAGRLSLLMRMLEERRPDLADNPRVRVHLANKAGLVPYLA